MKMIYVASLSLKPDRDSGWIYSFESFGLKVITFSSEIDINRNNLIERILNRLHIGPKYTKLQKKLLVLIDSEKPQWIHFRLPIEFSRKTIQRIKKKGIIITECFNDDPFSKKSPIGLNRKFRYALPFYDAHFVYRISNISDFHNYGAKYVYHCPPAYDPKRHNTLGINTSGLCIESDAAFIGHWEDDWRIDCLEALAIKGFSIIIKGGGWDSPLKDRSLSNLCPISHAFGEEYNQIYSSTIAGLCFFSKINRDTWTERALEIIAVGGVLVCERTEEAEKYFKDRVEAFFFSSIDELITIVSELKSNPALRESVKERGFNKLLGSKDTISDRAKLVYDFVKNQQ